MPGPTLHTQQIVDGSLVVGLRRRRLLVAVVKGPDRKAQHRLDGDRIAIGTHASCDVVLTDPTVSRHHCEIALTPEGYALRDLDSTNGTWIDKLRVREVVLDGDARVRVGDTVLRVTALDETVELPLDPDTRMGPLLGRSAAMRRVFEVLRKAAATDATVLITGESGTGKELAARAVHEASGRAGGPFVVVDCGSLPETLIESELFGHVRGAFTGALRDRAGAFQLASGGTLFLDELGELPLALQTRLLGALERRQVAPLGTSELRAVDVRVVAATNRDLRREVNRGAFREDLYYRLAVITVHMPPLRDRPEDVALYAEAFMAETGVALDAAVIERLAQQAWPGNVRELRNTLERAAALGEVELTDAQMPHVAGAVDVAVPFKVGKAALVEEYERNYVEALLRAHDDNITQAARAADIDRVYLLRLLDKYGLRPGRRT